MNIWRADEVKKNKDYHGFGLENIKDSINKYDDFLEIEKSDTVFSLKIIFKYLGMKNYENCNCR